jgi:hypothetical protein
MATNEGASLLSSRCLKATDVSRLLSGRCLEAAEVARLLACSQGDKEKRDQDKFFSQGTRVPSKGPKVPVLRRDRTMSYKNNWTIQIM